MFGVYLQPDDNDRYYTTSESESEPQGNSATHGGDPVSLSVMLGKTTDLGECERRTGVSENISFQRMVPAFGVLFRKRGARALKANERTAGLSRAGTSTATFGKCCTLYLSSVGSALPYSIKVWIPSPPMYSHVLKLARRPSIF